MAIPQTAREEIKRKVDIVEFIGQYVQLKKAGKDYVGLCPFHGDKDPSFTVSPQKQMFHCFGCKKGGDLFAFWMAYHGATFPEALKDLAERYHVPLDAEAWNPKEKQKSDDREALFRMNEAAAAYFEACLRDAAVGGPGRQYLEGRSISEATAGELRLGYAPDAWDSLLNHLGRHRLGLQTAAKAGLIIEKETSGHYDRFRGRIIFPILDTRKKVIGFGGRILGSGLPKYLNTPETPVFQKGRVLYGLHVSLNDIRQSGRAVIVEGYMDFLTVFQAGLRAVAATMGTALTQEHVRSLKGYAREAVLVFDADNAGRNAALRSLPLFLREGLTARAVELPPGEDPDSLVRNHGLGAFVGFIEKAPLLFDFFLAHKAPHADRDDIEGLITTLKEVLPLLAEIREDTPRRLYVKRLSEHLGIPEDMVWTELKKQLGDSGGGDPTGNLQESLEAAKAARYFGGDLQLLTLVTHHPLEAAELANCGWQTLVSDATVLEILELFFQSCAKEGPLSCNELQDKLDSEAARLMIRENLLLSPEYSKQDAALAVAEFKYKIDKINTAASFKSIKAQKEIDIHKLNQLCKRKAQELARRATKS